ncbi:MAG: polyhydroxyalkanoate depolymerase [Alphaproteobacteria bacterium]|nr:polyhydroxyalkanoate depolymerase [Alphaproteobacteria bacterium]
MFSNYGGIEKFIVGARPVLDMQASFLRAGATLTRAIGSMTHSPLMAAQFGMAARYSEAWATMLNRTFMEFPKPEFNLGTTEIDGQEIGVSEEDEKINPFLTLKHFVRDTDRKDPPVLLIAPMSGHYATLLRDTVKQMLPYHQVAITDWENPRDIPVSEGKFDLDNYTETIEQTLEHMTRKYGQRPHVIAVCQPTVPTLAATALMASEQNAARPASLTLMAGPIDVAAAHSEVSVFPTTREAEFEVYKNHAIQKVPPQFDGAGRSVYMAYAQLMCFIMMNPERHTQAHIDMLKNLFDGSPEALAQAKKDMDFYNEYLAVMDMTEEFYIDTIERVFINRELARGKMLIGDRHVNLNALKDIPVMTVEGGTDDISPAGQSSAVFGLLRGLADRLKFAHIEPEAGHYGVFAGSKWRKSIQPQIAAHIRNADKMRKIEHSTVPDDTLQQPKQARFVTPHAKKEPATVAQIA